MGHPHLDKARKEAVYKWRKGGMSYGAIKRRYKEEFGTQHCPIANGTIRRIVEVGDATGDPSWVAPRVMKGPHRKFGSADR